MLSKSILFYWSKGAETRRKMIRFIYECEKAQEACFLNILAKKTGLTHVAVKKHLDLLREEGYIEFVNPGGKPVYLKLSKRGTDVAKEFCEKKQKVSKKDGKAA